MAHQLHPHGIQSDNGMSIFQASYLLRGYCGSRKEIECIVIAETKSQALGQCLMQYTDTDARDWSLTEIDAAKNSVIHVSYYENY